ncbi:MAG TPA: hypothetical protein PK720_01325 [bacterium]|nr:hypothetical protein [bacterium]
MKYYYIPIFLDGSEKKYFWTTWYKRKIELAAKDLEQAKKEVEERYDKEKVFNLDYIVPGVSREHQKHLIATYPHEITLLSMQSPEVHIKDWNLWKKGVQIEFDLSPQ